MKLFAAVCVCSLAAAFAGKPITLEEVHELQKRWGQAILDITEAYPENHVEVAGKKAEELYNYGRSAVLFKPTKAVKHPFRPTGTGALSYFVGNVPGGYDEDGGFAHNNGEGWSKVEFNNAGGIDLNGDIAVAMGEYTFTNKKTGVPAKVEYTFGYMRNADGKARIFLHHSSKPYPMPTKDL